MAERSEIDRILADQYGQGIEPPPLTNFTADPQNELGTTATTADVGQVMDRMYSGVPGLFRSAADRVRGASRQDNILAGGLDTAANWVSGTPRIGEDTLAPLGLGALAMPFAVPGAVGIFGGRLARTADQDALRRAEEMATAGRPREDIWNETGWFRGRDGQWRFEIDDSAMRPQVPIVEWLSRREDGTLMAPNLETAYNVAARNLTPQAPMRAKRLFEHEELARAYPYGFNRSDQHGDIMGIPVQLMEGGSSAAMIAGHLPNVTIGLHESLPPGTARSAMLHELQHAVQQREGFTPGGSPRDAPGVYNDLADEINRLIAQSGGNLDRATPEVAARVGELRRQIRSIPSDPQQLYRHLAGEVEARNVQTRAGMSPEERRASPPWQTQDVPDVDQILRQYYGPQMSMGDGGGSRIARMRTMLGDERGGGTSSMSGRRLGAGDYNRILESQRATEGFRAAMRDPETGTVYTGANHQAAINTVPPSDTTGAWGRLSGEWDRATDNSGFVDSRGRFITRTEAERLYGISTMEDLRDLRAGRTR